MPTAYTPILQLALPATGELNGTWGTAVNDNITSMVEQAIAGLATINTWTAAVHTLTVANGTTAESRCAILECSGAPGAAATVICPTASKVYIIKNSVTGGFAVTLKTSAGTGISVANGTTALLYCDGTNVVVATANSFSAGTTGLTPSVPTSGAVTLAGTLAVANGGTGVTSSTGTGNTVLSTSPTLVTPALGTPASGVVTNLTGTASININGTVGATTPAAGAFTSVTASTTLGITGVSTLTAGAVVQGMTVGRGAGAIANNTVLGAAALASNTTGSNNSATGVTTLQMNTTGADNTAIGASALNGNTTGSRNTAVGYPALFDNTIGTDNTAIGYNTARGITTGTGNTVLGANIGGLAAALTNNIILANGSGAVKAQHDGTDWSLTGNVGIGTSSPVGKLDIISGTARMFFSNQSATAFFTAVNTANSAYAPLAINGSELILKTGDTERARIGSNGNLLVGRGSVGTGDRFVVQTIASGTIMLGYNSSATNVFQILDTGDVKNTNNSYGAISDIKLKENVINATPKLEKLNQVRIVNFNIIGNEQKQIGVIAQELEQIFPSMVDESPDRDEEGNDLGTTTKGVKYSVFVPILIKAIQEQQALILTLTDRVAALELK